jgi:tetratricopeptide (TPR) repeat protein
VAVVILAAVVMTRPPPKVPDDPREAEAKQRLEYARQAARERRLADAVQMYEEAEKLKPGIDRIGQLPKLREELKMQQDLAEVRRLLDQAKNATEQVAVAQVRFEDADSLFIKLPVDTVTFEDDRRALKQELHDTKVYYYLERLNEFLGNGDVPNAEAMLARIPADAQTDPAQKIADFKRQLESAEKEELLDERRRRANAAAAAVARRKEALTLAFAVVERKFISGEWERAASECNRVIDTNPTDAEIQKLAKTYKGLIPLFGRNYEDGLKKYRAKQYVYAAKPLQEAERSLRQMLFSTDKYRSEINQMLVESMVAKGNDAYTRENLLEAIGAYKEVLRVDPEHPRAKQGVIDVQSRCDEFFRTAYGLKDSEPGRAIRMLKMVKEICPEGSNARIGAENQLQALQQMPP